MMEQISRGQSEPGWKTIEECVPDPKLGWSSESDLGHSRREEMIEREVEGPFQREG